MNYITIGVLCTILACIFLYYILKNHYVTKLTKAMHSERYPEVVDMSNRAIYQRFIGSYVCDLYRVKAYTRLGDDLKFKEVLMEVVKKDYPQEKRKEFLELYLHYFLLKKDQEYATRMLEEIKALGEPRAYTYNEQAFDVMINGATDLIEVMEDEINCKQFNGFGLGVLVYMIGKQYYLLENKEEALTYFYNSLSCFHKSAIYVTSAKAYVEEICEELGRPLPKY